MKSRKSIAMLALLAVTVGGGWAYISRLSAGVDMTQSAEKFLGSLSPEQHQKAAMPLDTPQRVQWHFIPKKERKGLQIREMKDQQRELAHALLSSALSQVGYDKAVQIMELESVLRTLENRPLDDRHRDTVRYFFTIFGEPSAESRWGLSVEGHHLSLNFVVKRGKVVSSTPQVMGANPADVKSDYGTGVAKGTRVLVKEEELAFELVNSLTPEQRKVAVIADKAPRETRTAGAPQPLTSAPVGLAVAKMSADQTGKLKALIHAYTSNMPEEVAAERLAKIEAAGFDKIHFAWEGVTKPEVGHYYRIQGPTFFVEFVNTQPDPDGNPANHIHCIWRNAAGDFDIPIKQ